MSARILEGIRVLDFTRYVAGSFATRWLADLGADVLKVEPPGGDYRTLNLVRQNGALTLAFYAETQAIGGLSGAFAHSNAGKHSLCVNIKAPGALDLIRDLVSVSDVVIESFTPSVFQQWGLTYDALKAIKPDIIFVQASGFGQDTPDPQAVCVAPIASAFSGLAHATGEPDGYPSDSAFDLTDPVTGTVTAVALLAAIIHKLRTGEGQHVDTAMVDSMAVMDAVGWPHSAKARGEYKPMRFGHRRPTTTPSGTFRIRNEFVSIHAVGTGGNAVSGWGRLCDLMGRQDLITDPDWATDIARSERVDELWELIEGWLERTFPNAEAAAAAMQEKQILASRVNAANEMLNHPHYVRRQMVVDVEHPLIGALPTISTPNKYSQTPVQVGRSPFLGEHNEEALRNWLGMNEDRVAALYAAGVLEQDTLVGALRDSGELPGPWGT